MKSGIAVIFLFIASFVFVTADARNKCKPAFSARWIFSGRVLNCFYRCEWSIRNYALEENGTPCIIKYNRHGVCYEGYCVDNLPPRPIPAVTKSLSTDIPSTTKVVTKPQEVPTTQRSEVTTEYRPQERAAVTGTVKPVAASMDQSGSAWGTELQTSFGYTSTEKEATTQGEHKTETQTDRTTESTEEESRATYYRSRTHDIPQDSTWVFEEEGFAPTAWP